MHIPNKRVFEKLNSSPIHSLKIVSDDAIITIEAIIEMGAAVNDRITSLKDIVIYAIIPFNIFKGIVISVITALLYKKLSPVIHR